MKKMLIILTTLTFFTMTMTGCNSSSSQNETSDSTETTTAQQQVVDLNSTEEDAKWNETIEEFYKQAEDKDKYPYCDELYAFVKESSKLVDITIVIPDGTSDEDGLECATQIVKLFNDVALQNELVIGESSSDNYYGSLFDEYSVNLTVASPETAMYESQWLVCQNIPAGTHEAVQKGGYVG
jgi:hypothetical protein